MRGKRTKVLNWKGLVLLALLSLVPAACSAIGEGETTQKEGEESELDPRSSLEGLGGEGALNQAHLAENCSDLEIVQGESCESVGRVCTSEEEGPCVCGGIDGSEDTESEDLVWECFVSGANLGGASGEGEIGTEKAESIGGEGGAN